MKRFFTLLLTAVCAAAGMQAIDVETSVSAFNGTLAPNTKFYLGVTSLNQNGTDAGAVTCTVDDTYVATFRLPSSAEKLCGWGARVDVALQGVASLGVNGTKGISAQATNLINSTQDITNPDGTIGAYFVNSYNFKGATLAASIDGIPTTYNVSAAYKQATSLNTAASPDSATYIVASPADFQSTDRAWHELISQFDLSTSASGKQYVKIGAGSYIKNGDFYFHFNDTDAGTGDFVILGDSLMDSEGNLNGNYLLPIIERLGIDSIDGNMIDVFLKAGTEIALSGKVFTVKNDCRITCPGFMLQCLNYHSVITLMSQLESQETSGNALMVALFAFFDDFNKIVGEVDQADTITINIDFFPPVQMITPADSTIAAAMPQDASAEAQAAVKAVFKNAAVTGMTDAETGLASAVSVAHDFMYVNIELNAANADDNNVVDSMAFEVKPTAVIYNNGIKSVVTIPNSAITSDITFRLPIDKNVDSAYVNVYHQADANSEKTSLGQYTIQVDADGNKYIEISTSSFSIFSYAVPQPKQTPLEPTSLDSLTSTSVESGVYSLDGKKLNAVPAHGLYIKDGKVQFK